MKKIAVLVSKNKLQCFSKMQAKWFEVWYIVFCLPVFTFEAENRLNFFIYKYM